MQTADSSLPALWLIPARGGSKGIPGKNIKPFKGIPLVCLAAIQAIECASPEDTVFVSTDSAEISHTVNSHPCIAGKGVVPFLRPDEFATDTASSYDVIMHAIREFEKRGKNFSRIILLQPTSPLRRKEDISGATALWNPGIDMVVSVCLAKTNPYFNAFETDEKGMLHISKGDGKITRRQDAPDVWEYNGAVYVMTVTSLKRGPISTFGKILPFVMPAERSLDLDTEADWKIAESVASSLDA